MKQYRRFLVGIVLYFVVYLVGHFLVWKLFTEDLFTYHHFHGGDLARIGYVIDSKIYRKNHDDLPRRHIPFKDYSTQRIDVLTVGDSFSNGVAGGRNRYYQDYIASIHNLNVLNIGLYNDAGMKNGFNDPFETVLILYNSGALQKIRPRYLLLESAEIQLPERMSREIDFRHSAPLVDVMNPDRYQSYQFDPQVSWINNGNVKFCYYTVLQKLGKSPSGAVCSAKLDRPLFSAKNSDLLLFTPHEKTVNTSYGKQDVETINRNLNKLGELLGGMGITLYFMPAPNKSTVYYDYLVDKTIPRSILFEELRNLPRNYYLIDTKAILASAVGAGEKDVYYPDDTHWSWKASKMIFEAVRFH